MESRTPPGARRPQNNYACEACRVAKVKCQPSSQSGICKRCLGSKRECVFKTGPRTRRPRRSKLNRATTPIPAPPGPSKTFTIDIPMPSGEAPASGLEALRQDHMARIADLLPPEYDEEDEYVHSDGAGDADGFGDDDDDEYRSRGLRAPSSAGRSVSPASSLPLGASALRTPPASAPSSSPSTTAAATATWGVRPRFNLDSARNLLSHFREDMLSHFPALAWDSLGGEAQDAGGETSARGSVEDMAKRHPFLLLAVLAAASGSRTLQGHSLYDEEFRKVLGLKFVAGGERSLELLQGLVVYCAWYPFHLRPRNKQVFQYVRMAIDIVNDLGLDKAPDSEAGGWDGVSGSRLEVIRTYLAIYYLTSRYATVWRRTPSIPYTQYTAKCSDVLEMASPVHGDRLLAWLVKLQHLAKETSDSLKSASASQNEYQEAFVLKGMEVQLDEWEVKMAPDISSNPSLRLSLLFTRVFLYAAPLFKSFTKSVPPAPSAARVDPTRLAPAVPALRALFDFIISLNAVQINAFSSIEWGSFIMAVVAAVRISFPLQPACPEWDNARARRELDLGNYLMQFETVGGGSSGDDGVTASFDEAEKQNSVDVLTATKVVLRVVRQSYKKRAAKVDALQQRHQEEQRQVSPPAPPSLPLQFWHSAQSVTNFFSGNAPATSPGPSLDPNNLLDEGGSCPMMDGSMQAYLPYWDENLAGVDLGNLWAERGASSSSAEAPGLPDLNPFPWEQMTMEWPAPNDISFDGTYGG